MKKRLLAMLLLLVICLSACGGKNGSASSSGKGSEGSSHKDSDFGSEEYEETVVLSYPQEILQEIEAEVGTPYEENGMILVDVQATCPDFTAIMPDSFEHAEEKAQTAEEFDTLFHEKIIELLSSLDETETITFTCNLTEIDGSKEEWTEQELLELAQNQAFYRYEEAYALEILEEVAPTYDEVVYYEGD
ncbi:MAG: hypothetical protein IKT58_06370 [Oscillospiraceae bacterium]|nr:hypothetical protein [Oscillospiraceae bacterium]